MSRLLVDDVTKTDRRALLNVNKMATISDIVAPTREYLRASGADELTVESGCVIAVGGAGIFKTAETKLTVLIWMLGQRLPLEMITMCISATAG